jgi:CRP-like cAMP-binding protein
MFPRKAEWFGGISLDAQRVIDDLGTRQTFKAGDVIFREEEEGRYFYILEQGRINYLVGKVQQICFLVTHPGEIFGWSSIVAPHRYIATALAINDSTLTRVPREAVDRIANEYPSDGERIYWKLSAMVRRR